MLASNRYCLWYIAWYFFAVAHCYSILWNWYKQTQIFSSRFVVPFQENIKHHRSVNIFYPKVTYTKVVLSNGAPKKSRRWPPFIFCWSEVISSNRLLASLHFDEKTYFFHINEKTFGHQKTNGVHKYGGQMYCSTRNQFGLYHVIGSPERKTSYINL